MSAFLSTLGSGANKLMGPTYNYADELPMPQELGVGSSGSMGQMMNNIQGVNYYMDAIAFGKASGINSSSSRMRNLTRPLGINYFLPTGSTCTNGQPRFEYIQNIPKGDLLGKRISESLAATLGVELKGLAPGMLEDARDGLNPFPLIQSMMGKHARCRQVSNPVGDSFGRLCPRDVNIPNHCSNKKRGTDMVCEAQYQQCWVDPRDTQSRGGRPHQTRWVLSEWVGDEEAEKDRAMAKRANEGFFGEIRAPTVALPVVIFIFLVWLWRSK